MTEKVAAKVEKGLALFRDLLGQRPPSTWTVISPRSDWYVWTRENSRPRR
jgi:hypothetical protein